MAVTTLPPGPKRQLPGSALIGFRRDPTGFLERLAAHGEVAHVRVGGQPLYLLSNPAWIGDVLVTNHRNFVKGRGLQQAKRVLGEGLLTSEGEFHLRQRRLVQPAFHRKRVAAYGDTMAAYAARSCGRWQDGATLNVADEMMRLTLAIVGKTLFDADVERDAADVGAALTALIEMFSLVTLPFSGLLERLPLPANRRFRESLAQLDTVIYRMIAERRQSGDRGDLLSMLLLARDEESGGAMSDVQVRDEALTIFLAGHETTAVAMTWTLYLLAQQPEAERQLHAELDAALGGRLPTADDVARLPYTRMVLAESMRLYPPAWLLGRRALDDYDVGGYRIPAGAIVLASQWVTHRDPRFYPDPLRFDPQRWLPEAQAARPKWSYFPFGGGPRICIGEQFAWMEGILLLATIAQRWRLRLSSNRPVATRPLITLRPRDGLWMVAERRKETAYAAHL